MKRCVFDPFNPFAINEGKRRTCLLRIGVGGGGGVALMKFKGKVPSRKSSSTLPKLLPRNSKIITVLSSSLLRCDKSTLKLPLS